ncbi:MFS transporter [Nocardia sp. NBC_01730]|uniref:MFS transporter n=1 Tax=Nocardia sp. NBC_01730 TaxID=2975998 RepID=UPI002E14BD91|nr:MFS transporter [Nocardia sp. NBC_01730]
MTAANGVRLMERRRRCDLRRFMLLSTAGVFLAGNTLSLVGPSYDWILAGRIIAALAHGAFFGIAAVFAAELVAAAMKGRAIATVFAGSTAATILGAPIGATVGKALGWRATFGTLVVFGTIAVIGLLLLPRGLGRERAREAASETHGHTHDHRTAEAAGLDGHTHDHTAAHGTTPKTHRHSDNHDGSDNIVTAHGRDNAIADTVSAHTHNHDAGAEVELDAHAKMHMGGSGSTPLRAQLRALRRPAVLVGLLTTLLGYGGVFTSYVYLAPQLSEATGLGSGWVTPMFLLFGVGLFAGNQLGGKLADRNLPLALAGSVGSLTVILFAMTLLIHHPITAAVGILAYGVAAFSVVAPLQLRVMHKAGDAPDIASAANISAFTLGSALGIWLGGAAIDGGWGITSVNWVGGLIAGAGFLLTPVSPWLDRVIAAEPFESAPVQLTHHH